MENKKMISRFVPNKYFQKSENLLYPFLDIPEHEDFVKTYLYWPEVEECILDHMLLVQYKKGYVLQPHKKFVKRYELEEYDMYVFDMGGYKTEIDHFLNGRYSLYPQASKDKILKYNNWVTGTRASTPDEAKKNVKAAPHFPVMLYPQEFRAEIATELALKMGLYDSVEEALQVIESVTEFASLFDLEQETCKLLLPVIEDCLL